MASAAKEHKAATVVDAFANFDPLSARLTPAEAPAVAAAPAAATAATAPAAAAAADSSTPQDHPRSHRRNRRRPRVKGAPSQLPSAPGGGAAAASPAPWDVDPEAEAAEKREDARKALREAIKAKREGRMGKHALQSQAAQRGDEGGVLPGGQDALGALSGVDARMLQAILKSQGVTGDASPSMRKLRRAMASMPESYLMAKASAAKR